METGPRKTGGQPPLLIEAIVERLIPGPRRVHFVGDLRERYVSLPQYLPDAAVMVAFAIACHVRRALNTSPMFEPKTMGLLIAILGFLAGLYKTPGPSPPPANGFDFLFGLMSGGALTYWVWFRSGRSIWISALLVILLTVQLCLVLLNAFPGHLPNLSFGGSGMVITLLAVFVTAIQRWLCSSEKR